MKKLFKLIFSRSKRKKQQTKKYFPIYNGYAWEMREIKHS